MRVTEEPTEIERTLEDDTVQKGSTDELRVGLILGLSEE